MKYKTDDLIQAAYLVATGYVVEKIEVVGPMKGAFIFKHVDDSVVDNFLLGNATVEPMKFNTTLRQLVTAVRQKCK